MVKILRGRIIKKKKKKQRNFIRELMDSQEVWCHIFLQKMLWVQGERESESDFGDMRFM